MLLRLIVENIASFKEATEYNMFPSSKSKSHNNHKIKCGHATVLRMSAIYGANGAGKSNLINALGLLQAMMEADSLEEIEMFDVAFMLDKEWKEKPSGLAVEFCSNNNVFYYHIEFVGKEITTEELLLSKKNTDETVFARYGTNIELSSNFFAKGVSNEFKDFLTRMVRPDMLLLSFFGKKYPEESSVITDAYKWFNNKLQIVLPNSKYGATPHMFDTNSKFKDLVNNLVPELKTGVDELIIEKKIVTDTSDIKNEELTKIIRKAKENPDRIYTLFFHEDAVNIVYEDGEVWMKKLVAVHKNLDGTATNFAIANESDGTRRLIEYMPLLYSIIQNDTIYVVDEIERSLHPIMIKDIIRKISESETAKGQLIFTTHESCLLDQSIFRPDEIWFAQKDVEQATQLYPLSDFNIHKTANIENGYLDGRYGGIPFLSNLKDLNW